MRSGVFCLVLLVAAGLAFLDCAVPLDRALVDAQFRYLRANALRSAGNDVVIVGIDDDSMRAMREPLTLSHLHPGKFLEATANAGAAVGSTSCCPTEATTRSSPATIGRCSRAFWSRGGPRPSCSRSPPIRRARRERFILRLSPRPERTGPDTRCFQSTTTGSCAVSTSASRREAAWYQRSPVSWRGGSAGATLVALYLDSGDEYLFKGPATIEFRSGVPDVSAGAKPEKRSLQLGKDGKQVRNAVHLGGFDAAVRWA
jgi:hypothetical protein